MLARLRSLITGLTDRSSVEANMNTELRFHIEARAADLAATGIDPHEAQRRARLEFGAVEKYKEEIRGARGLRLLDEIRADLRCGLRSFRRNPAFAIVATLSLALGIGANTLVFSVLDSTFLSPLGYRDPSRLVVVWTIPNQKRASVQISTSSVSTYFALRDQNRSFETVGAFNGGGCGVRSLGADADGASAERIFGQCFSPSLFSVLGIKPQIGRIFTDAEDQVGNVANVVLISDGLWKRRFGGDAGILGKTIVLNRVPSTVIGILPADFELFKDPNSEATRDTQLDFVLPLELTPTQVQSRVGGLTIVGRLKPGTFLSEAQAELDTITAQLAVSDPERHDTLASLAEPFRGAAFRDYRSPLLILEGAVAFVLLIGCANVAGLLLARGASRRTEVALRMALGGSRWRIVRQLVTENFPVAILGGAIGFVLASVGLNLFVATAPRDFPRLDRITLDTRVLAFTALTVLISGVVSAIVPALQIAKGRFGDSLKESSRGTTSSSNRLRTRSVLVVGQVALAMILLVGAGLMIQSFLGVLQKDLGADPRNLLMFDFRLTMAETVQPAGRYRGMGLWGISPTPAQKVERVLERLRQLQPVSAVAAINIAPFRNQTMTMPFLIEGRPAPASFAVSIGEGLQTSNYFAVTPGFFSVMKTPLIEGRDFSDRDTADSALVMIINQTMAHRFFPGEDPIGKRITVDWVPNERPREIVGVVGDTAASPLQREQAPAMYVPHLQQTSTFTGPLWTTRSGMYFVVRAAAAPMSVVPAIKAAVAEIDANTPVAEIRTAEDTIGNQVRNLRLYMLLLGVFAAVATVLAATGIYGVMAYSVAERTNEIGIRMALGADARDVLTMIFKQATAIIGVGVVVGLAGALALSSLLQSVLFGVTATDPATYVAVSILLLLTATIACLIPTRRAIAVDPALSLKEMR
jgi:putative ABC transport system permease protein